MERSIAHDASSAHRNHENTISMNDSRINDAATAAPIDGHGHTAHGEMSGANSSLHSHSNTLANDLHARSATHQVNLTTIPIDDVRMEAMKLSVRFKPFDYIPSRVFIGTQIIENSDCDIWAFMTSSTSRVHKSLPEVHFYAHDKNEEVTMINAKSVTDGAQVQGIYKGLPQGPLVSLIKASLSYIMYWPADG